MAAIRGLEGVLDYFERDDSISFVSERDVLLFQFGADMRSKGHSRKDIAAATPELNKRLGTWGRGLPG